MCLCEVDRQETAHLEPDVPWITAASHTWAAWSWNPAITLPPRRSQALKGCVSSLSVCQESFTMSWILSVPWRIHSDCFTCHLNLVSRFARLAYSFESALMMLPSHNGWRGHVRRPLSWISWCASQWLARYSSYGGRVGSDYTPMFWTQKSKSWLHH